MEAGPGLRILALNAEPSAEWVRSLPDDLLVAGYSGRVFGYLPVEADVPHGGYEVHGHMQHFYDQAATWQTGYQEKVLNTIAQALTTTQTGG